MWVRAVLVEIARTLLWTYFYAIVLYALFSLIAPGGYSPLQSVLSALCEPVLRPIRRAAAVDRRHRFVATVGRDPHPGDSHPVALTAKLRATRHLRCGARHSDGGSSARKTHA